MNAHTLAYRPRVTVVDVLDSGACIEGTLKFIESQAGALQIEGDTEKLLRSQRAGSYVAKAANADLDGYGNGYGDGNGDGYGDGYGYGYGDGDGYGYGYGYGNGDGNGDGDGDGYGYGDGDGDG